MFKFPACGSGEVGEDLSEVRRSVLREAGHDVRGADGAAQAERLLAADDGEGFFRRDGSVVHPGQEVAVRIDSRRQELADRWATLEERKHEMLNV